MKIDQNVFESEIIIYTKSKEDVSYIAELIENALEINKSFVILLTLATFKHPYGWLFTHGFILALKMISEQERINQEDELERIMNIPTKSGAQ